MFINAQEIDTTWMNINNLKIPAYNHGSLGLCGGGSSAKFDDIVLMCSSGFYISGYVNDSLWSTGVFPSTRKYDFAPGNVEKVVEDSLYKFYKLFSTDEEFGKSWQDWRSAVMQGAKFYDGDGDSIYNPVDLNENGIWDKGEDKPDLLGDQTVWSVSNDALPNIMEHINHKEPVGIEVKQTLFGVNPETNEELSNVVFVRYIVTNTGMVSDVIDSTLFGVVVDPDIGDYVDDLPGCDSLREVSYSYNQGTDEQYGDNAPCLMLDLLQGPQAFIPGETFIDNNGSGYFEEEIDTPLDSAYLNNGETLGRQVIHGARNQRQRSNSPMDRGAMEPADDEIQTRSLLRGGYQTYGKPIDPCAQYWSWESTIEDCENENVLYPFNGDPVTNEGWVRHQWQGDVYMLSSTGPFDLRKDEPVEIWAAFVVGRGIDSLNSITVAREIDDYVQKYYEANFDETKVSVKEKKVVELPNNFRLEQNYPNPFNPSTIIKYKIPDQVRNDNVLVELKVFDVLGREVATLVNKEQQAGSYEVQFDASSLTSGIYFYKLQSGGFVESRKMVLLK